VACGPVQSDRDRSANLSPLSKIFNECIPDRVERRGTMSLEIHDRELIYNRNPRLWNENLDLMKACFQGNGRT
jgi:hypothetical protein